MTDRYKESSSRTVAIGCQGGGSHSAFVAGALQELFEREFGGYALHGLSGTSGGALCAVTAWYGLVAGDERRAVTALDSLWRDLSADSPVERSVNNSTKSWADLEASGFPVAHLGPYDNPASWYGQAFLRRVIEDHVEFDDIPDHRTPASPRLLISAVDVVEGDFEVFGGDGLTAEKVLASAAVPRLFPAVTVGETPHWDGMFAQNPPIRNFLTDPDAAADKPDEIWIVQVNPARRDQLPTSLDGIADRRRELAGNLALGKELAFVEQINEFVEEGRLDDDSFKHVDVRRILVQEELSYASRFDRSHDFLRELMERGRERAQSFLDDLP